MQRPAALVVDEATPTANEAIVFLAVKGLRVHGSFSPAPSPVLVLPNKPRSEVAPRPSIFAGCGAGAASVGPSATCTDLTKDLIWRFARGIKMPCASEASVPLTTLSVFHVTEDPDGVAAMENVIME